MMMVMVMMKMMTIKNDGGGSAESNTRDLRRNPRPRWRDFIADLASFCPLPKATPGLVRFPNCHECQLGFQCPKKLEIGKQWLVVEKNYIATVIKLGKLTSSASQEKMSAKKNSQRFMVSRLEDQTCPPLNPHFGWRPISLGGFVLLMKLYLRELIFPISHQSNSKRY